MIAIGKKAIIQEIIALFRKQDRSWFINKEYKEPNIHHVEYVLDLGKRLDGGQVMETGGILLSKYDDDTLDVYVHVGTLTKDEEDDTEA